MDGRTTGGRPAGPGLLAVLLGAVGIGPLLTYGLSATSELVIRDLGISEVEFGFLATACFAAGALGNAALGRFSDGRSDRFLMVAVYALAALALAAAAVPGGYLLLLIAASLAGLAQSFPNGVTNRILLRRVPAAKRIGWTGIKQSGVQASQLAASLTFPALALWIGWRGASAAGAVLALALLVVTLRQLATVRPLEPYAPPEPAAPASSGVPSVAPVPGPARAARARQPFLVWALAAFGFLNGLGVQATNIYLPLFAVREMGFSLVLGGIVAATAGAVGVVARVGWARAMSRGVSARALLVALGSIALAGAGVFLAAGATGHAALLWTAVALHGISALGVSVVIMAALLRNIPAASMGSASGIVTAGLFAGFAIGPLLMGASIAATGGFAAGWMVVAGTYACCVLLAVYLVRRARKARG
ncbi:MFS transporter [Arthrobacter sp. KK5.5]|uniref:MFS transporter n=1 Tax=Arthrobacter sp. KK5.5 TaxID=3373084 RepID=UPI003EE791FA